MKNELRNKVGGACQYLLQNFEQEFGEEGDDDSDDQHRGFGGLRHEPGADVNTSRNQHRRRTHVAHADAFYSDGESSFGESSLNHVRFKGAYSTKAKILERFRPILRSPVAAVPENKQDVVTLSLCSNFTFFCTC